MDGPGAPCRWDGGPLASAPSVEPAAHCWAFDWWRIRLRWEEEGEEEEEEEEEELICIRRPASQPRGETCLTVSLSADD